MYLFSYHYKTNKTKHIKMINPESDEVGGQQVVVVEEIEEGVMLL